MKRINNKSNIYSRDIYNKYLVVIMIAHRLNILKDCDQVYILEKDKIIGQGKYEELIGKINDLEKLLKW